MENYHLLSGAPGSGKSTILALLSAQGYRCIDEPARQVIAEQRRIGGAGVPDKDPRLFTDLLLSRHLADHEGCGERVRPVFFDRGVTDVIAYANWYGLDITHLEEASRQYRYATRVYFAPNWPDIYCQDEERRMTCDESARFGDSLRDAYRELGYTLVELPKSSAEERVRFILSDIG